MSLKYANIMSQIEYMEQRGSAGSPMTNYLRYSTDSLIEYSADRFGAKGDGLTDDTRAIQNAIDELEGTGGIVFLSPGLYVITGIQMRTGVTLRGAGIAASAIKLRTGSSKPQVSLANTGVHSTVIENLTIGGNRGGQTNENCLGIYYVNTPIPVDESGAKHILRNLHIEYCYGDCVYLDVSDGSCFLENVYTLHSNKNGFRIKVPDSMFVGCQSGQHGEMGFYVDSKGGNRFVGCKAFRNGRVRPELGTGFFINSNGNQFSACASQDNKLHGWDIYQSDHNVISSAESESNGFTSEERSQAAYRINGGAHNIIQGTAWNRGAVDIPPGGGNRYSISLVNNPEKNIVQIANSDAIIAPMNGDEGSNLVTVL